MSANELFCDCGGVGADVIRSIGESMPDAREFELISVFFKVFGDATRAKILWALHERELCGCDLAELLSMSKSAISHQLSYLRQNRLVSARRSGKSVFYSLADDHIKNILEVGREHINE